MLPIMTVFAKAKITARVEATHIGSALPIAGYEIHCGRLIRRGGEPLFHFQMREDRRRTKLKARCPKIAASWVHRFMALRRATLPPSFLQRDSRA